MLCTGIRLLQTFWPLNKKIILDVEVSPPAKVHTDRQLADSQSHSSYKSHIAETAETFDFITGWDKPWTVCIGLFLALLNASIAIEPCNLNHFLKYEFWWSDKLFSSLNSDEVTDRQKVMHMSPPCIRTGVLKKSELKTLVRCHP